MIFLNLNEKGGKDDRSQDVTTKCCLKYSRLAARGRLPWTARFTGTNSKEGSLFCWSRIQIKASPEAALDNKNDSFNVCRLSFMQERDKRTAAGEREWRGHCQSLGGNLDRPISGESVTIVESTWASDDQVISPAVPCRQGAPTCWSTAFSSAESQLSLQAFPRLRVPKLGKYKGVCLRHGVWLSATIIVSF